MIKLVYGVGILDADYMVQVKETIILPNGKSKRKLVWCCPFYRKWKHMLERGYSEKYKLRQPTYKDVTVCEEWHRFSTFKYWMEQQDWQGKQLDKDILVQGNKVYSPDKCVFVSQQINNFLTDSAASRGICKIGVSWHKESGKYQANCNNPISGKKDYLGLFTCEEEAHKAWLARKLEYATAIADGLADRRIAKAIVDYYKDYTI